MSENPVSPRRPRGRPPFIVEVPCVGCGRPVRVPRDGADALTPVRCGPCGSRRVVNLVLAARFRAELAARYGDGSGDRR